MRIAILGTFNSGSSAVARIMGHLGFELGHPLWFDFHESRSLRAQLLDWWDQTTLTECVAAADRIPFLKWWAEYNEQRNPLRLVCAKHPLLGMAGFDLETAWGPDFKVIHTSRPLEDATEALTRRGWFHNPYHVQATLDRSIRTFLSWKQHHVIEFTRLLASPEKEVARLATFLGFEHLGSDQLALAASIVERTGGTSV